MSKNIVDVKVKEDNTILLPEKVAQHLGVMAGENVRILLAQKSVILMTVEQFGEELLKKI